MPWAFCMSGRPRGAATRVTVCGAVRPPEPRVDQSEGTVERSDPMPPWMEQKTQRFQQGQSRPETATVAAG